MEFNETYEDTLSTVSAAVIQGNVAVLRDMIEAGRPTNFHDNRGWKPLHHAAHRGSKECVDLLVRASDCDVNWRTFEGETALYLSVIGLKGDNVVINVDERRNVVRYLLKRDDVDVNQDDNYGTTPLHLAALVGDSLVVKWLVRRGANVNAVSNWGQIPIHCAVESKVDDEDGVNVAYLIKHGSNLWHQDENHLTPMSTALLANKPQHVDLILDSIEQTGGREALEKYVNMFAKVYTPLMIAASKPNYRTVLRLLEAGADPNTRSRCPQDFMALHVACEVFEDTDNLTDEDRAKTVKKLIEVTDFHCLVECSNSENGSSPYKLAIDTEYWKGLKILIESNLTADTFIDKVRTRSREAKLYEYSTPLATFMPASAPEHERFAKMFIDRGSSVNGNVSLKTLPPILSKISSDATFRLLVKEGARIPHIEGGVLLIVNKDVRQFRELINCGIVHPELIFSENNLRVLEKMILSANDVATKKMIAARMTDVAKIVGLTLGSGLDRRLVTMLYNILVNNCPEFPGENEQSVFDELRLLIGPSNLKLLARNSVRRHLLASCPDKMSSNISGLTGALPIELQQFLLFSDIA